MVQSAKKSMTREQLDEYKEKQKVVGECIDMIEKTKHNTGQEGLAIDSRYDLGLVVESLKAGMNPDYLEEDEVRLMVEFYGENWKDRWQI